MSIHDKLEDLKDQKRYSIPAKRILEHLKPILSKSDELRKRWMWELLQNASDLGDKICTEFEITDTQLIFRHNGKPFGLDEAYNLIMPDSSKDEESLHSKDAENPPIGRFGTGFISTHILSKKIRINGIVVYADENEKYSFSFQLDRTERESKNCLIESIKNSEKEYEESLKEYEESLTKKEYKESLTKLSDFEPSRFDTEFTYELKETYSSIDGFETINEGIKTLDDLLPFVFSFRPQLKKVSIKDYRNNKSDIKIKTYERNQIKSKIDEIELIQTTCKLNGELQNKTLIATIKKDNTTVAIKVKNIDGKPFEIQDFPDYSPILYCAFPMIGTTNFNFPVVVHSEFFRPNIERDGIEISKHDEKNRNRLKEAKNAFFTLIDVVEKHKWNGAYHLFKLSKLDFLNEEIRNWYDSNIFTPIKERLREAKVIREKDTLDSRYLSIDSTYLPYVDKKKSDKLELLPKVYLLSKKLLCYALPLKSTYSEWYSKIEYDIFGARKLDIEKISRLISEKYTDIKDISKEKNITEELTIKYLIELIQFIFDHKYDKLLIDRKIVPNQNGSFCLLKKLKKDSIFHESLKEDYYEKIKSIGAKLTDEDCKDFLLHKDFESIPKLIDSDEKYKLSELCTAIDDKLRNFDGSFNDDNFLLILKDLFHWHTNCGISEESLNKLFPYFSSNKSQLYLNTKTPEDLEYAFDIEISGKSQVLAKIAKSNLTKEQLAKIAENTELVTSFINWVNDKDKDNPDEELGNTGEGILHSRLRQIFGKDRVLWEDKSEYDFRILETDLDKTKYYIDAKTTGKGIANTENVPFYMRTAQWNFLDKEQAFDKYVIARVYRNGSEFDVKYVKINLTEMK